MKQVFVSHITEEAGVAAALKKALKRDFLNLLDVFVSSDRESIAAGELWLTSIDRALKEAAALVILCSPESIHRPWINFEAGGAWMRGIPIIPACHMGLTPRDLRVPLSLRQGVLLSDPDGLRQIYLRVAEVLGCGVPQIDFGQQAHELRDAEPAHASEDTGSQVDVDRAIIERLQQSLQRRTHKWRTLERVAIEAGISQELGADLLRAIPEVRFSKSKRGQIIVGLRERVGEGE